MSRRSHVLILLENLPLEKDARVRRQSRALVDAGHDVTVVCPRGAREDPVPGVRVLSYPAPPEGDTPLAFLVEYSWSLAASAVITARLAITRGFDVIQACNPPDLFWLLALPYRLRGTPFVFDHHDLSPELYAARSGRTTGILATGLRLMERISLRLADHVIATNDSVKEVSLTRGGRRPESVTVVRNGPELHRLRHAPGRPELRAGYEHLVVWLGVIGVDDGVEDALRAVHELVHVRGRTDCRVAFVGDGERLEACRELAVELDIASHVVFPGWLEQDEAYAYLATADVALAPDPPSPRSHRSTMMKIMEYMAAGLPVVARDVVESRVSAAGAAVYAGEGSAEYAAAVDQLLDDPPRRREMGEIGRRRIADGLSWDHQEQTYLRVFDALLGSRST